MEACNRNGTCWLDDRGEPIQAHGGMITRFGDTWYWYGEDKGAPNTVRGGKTLSRVDVIGISCYSSHDLLRWHREGLALRGEPTGYLAPECVCERPKVLYCAKTGQYVMWLHCDSADYTLAAAGCAVADRPEGPFRLLSVQAPNRRDCRDMTLWQEADGRAWLIHSGDWNKTLYLSELDDTLTRTTGLCLPLIPEQEREAPVMLLRGGRYHLLTSGCTGWAPNAMLTAESDRLYGTFRISDNPCEGEGRHTTWNGQPTWSFRANGKDWLMLDHWKPMELCSSGYSILPIDDEQGRLRIRWTERFDPMAE